METDKLDCSLDQTIRVPVSVLPPDAMPESMNEPMPATLRVPSPALLAGAMLVDEDTPTLVVVPSALAALAQRSVEAELASARPRRHREDDEVALRRAVYGIWLVAAVLFAALGLLIR